jgi:hypothetical protein
MEDEIVNFGVGLASDRRVERDPDYRLQEKQ